MTELLHNSRVESDPPVSVSLSNIDQSWGQLWQNFSQKASDKQALLRACMSNLIIYCDSETELKELNHELPVLVDSHPARILLLNRTNKSKSQEIKALASLYFTSLDGGWQICGERLDLKASEQASERLPSIVRAQLVGDLPTTLWWFSRQPPPEAGELFFELAELSNQIIYDSMGWINPAKGVLKMTRWVAAQQEEHVIYNLAWRRLAGWRKFVSQVLDPSSVEDALSSIKSVEIDHGPHGLTMAWLLVGWLASRLKWQLIEGKILSKSELIWSFQCQASTIKVKVKRLSKGDPVIHQFGLTWGQGKQVGKAFFERLENRRLGIIEAKSTLSARTMAMPSDKRPALVAGQLAHRNRDKLFEASLEHANGMASVLI